MSPRTHSVACPAGLARSLLKWLLPSPAATIELRPCSLDLKLWRTTMLEPKWEILMTTTTLPWTTTTTTVVICTKSNRRAQNVKHVKRKLLKMPGKLLEHSLSYCMRQTLNPCLLIFPHTQGQRLVLQVLPLVAIFAPFVGSPPLIHVRGAGLVFVLADARTYITIPVVLNLLPD